MKAYAGFILSMSILWLIVGCTTGNAPVQTTFEPQSTPTTHSFFSGENSNQPAEIVGTGGETAVPTVAGFFSARSTSTPHPTATPRATTAAPTRDISSLKTESFVIYDDELNENWMVLDNPDAEIDLASTTQVQNGENAIAFTPLEDFTTLYFAVSPDSNKTFSSRDVLGFSFWLNSGDDYIEYDELAVAVIGSNEYTYWRADDTSVDFPAGDYFSETRLYFLGLNGSIPPNTWVQIYVWMDILIYDPVTNYITGFYIKNDEGFYNTIYIDDLEMVLLAQSPSTEEQPGDSPGESAPAEGTVTPDPLNTPAGEGTAVSPESTPPSETISPTDDEPDVCVISPPPGWVQYTIQPNDAVSNLAVQAGVAPDTVISVNCLEPNGILSVGKQLWLPQFPPTRTPAPAPPTG